MPYEGLTLQLKGKEETAYWTAKERSNYTQEFVSQTQKFEDFPDIFLVTFSDRVAPSAVAFITGSG